MTYQKAGVLAKIGDCFGHNTYMYILYLRCEEPILAILCTDLPIITIYAGEWLNSLIFNDNVESITANG